jgi:hypothetical protein
MRLFPFNPPTLCAICSWEKSWYWAEKDVKTQHLYFSLQLCEDAKCGFFFKTLINLHFRANVIFFYSFFRDFKPFCNSTIFFFEIMETVFALIFRMMGKSFRYE